MSTAAFTMAPTDPLWFTSCLEAHCTAKTASRVDIIHQRLLGLGLASGSDPERGKYCNCPSQSQGRDKSGGNDKSTRAWIFARCRGALTLARLRQTLTQSAMICAPPCWKMPNPNRLSARRSAQRSSSPPQPDRQSPLLRPEDFEVCNGALSLAADRILRMAKKRVAHRQELESRTFKAGYGWAAACRCQRS